MKELFPRSQPVGIRLLGVAVLSLLCFAEGVGSQHPAPTAGGAAPLPPQLQELFNQGVQALSGGQLDVAEDVFLRVLKEGGKVAYVHNNLGIVYQQRGESERALAQFREAIRLQPDYVAPRVLMGSTLLALGRLPEATRELETAVKLQPKDPLARLQLAKAYRRREDMLQAVEQFQALRELAPQDPEYAYQSGRAYLDLSAWCYQRIIDLNPRSARAYQTLAENFREQKRPELAIRAYQHAAQLDPKLPEIHLALAQIYDEQGKDAEAKKEIEQELTVVPESAAASALKKKLRSR